MSKTQIFQSQITGSLSSEINDNVSLSNPSITIYDDLNKIRTQLKKVLNAEGTWKDIPSLTLHGINSMFTGTLNINDLSVAGNTTIDGDLTVLGSVSSLSTTNTEIKDSIIGLGFSSGSSGVMSGDRGWIGSLNGSNNIAMVWDDSESEFVLGKTTSNITSETISFSEYSNLHAANVQGSIITASLGFSGSLTKLADGTSYLIAGNNITIATSSNGSIVISGLSGDITSISAGTGLVGGGTSGDIALDIDNSVVATISGSTFTGAVKFNSGLSGSLTNLEDGSPYLVAGDGITITTASNGSVLISSFVEGSPSFFQSTTNGSVFTTGSVAFIGNNQLIDSPADVGTDVFFFVSGAMGDSKKAVFGGDVRISGSLALGQQSAYLRVQEEPGSIVLSPHPEIIPIGSDTFFFVSGSPGNGDKSVFGGDIVASGTISSHCGFTGSLTTLTDGSSYLIAGSNVTITTSSNGSIVISSTGGGGGGGGSIDISSADVSISPATSLKFGPGFILSEESTGVAVVSASIGDPEDGSYQDGIFKDFTPSTPIGIAIDRFNELFLSLAPAPAPDLDNLDCDTSAGVTAFLSFGSSNDQSSASPAYISSTTTAGFSAVNVNGSYGTSTSGGNIRKGIYNGSTSILGDLNEDIPAYVHNTNVTNYVANSFGNADQGTLELYVNGALAHSVNLTLSDAGSGVPGSGTASKLNINGSGFTNLSQTGSAVQSNALTFEPFQHRTGKYVVHPTDQRNGWNYARVVHNKGSTQTQTNYVEWINDSNADSLSASNSSLSFEGSGSIDLSGVRYFQSGSLIYRTKVDNAYKYIYDDTAITFTTSNSSAASSGLSVSFASQAKPIINIAGGENHTKSLHLTASSVITANYFTSGSITVGTNVTHPLKSNLVNGGQATSPRVLTYNYTNTSTETAETFRRENYRILSGSYDAQAEVIDNSNVWNSTVFMTSSNGGHSDGLQFFNATLVSPKNTTNGGNFSTFSGGPSGNPNYSGTTGTRTFYRWFKNTTGVQYDLSLTMDGSSTIVSDATALNATRIKTFVKVPGKTGWMDVALPFTLDQVQDGAGSYISNAYLSFDSTLNATNYLNFGNVEIANNEYLVLKIIADSSWTGNISSIVVDFGAGTGTLTPVPDLDDIDSDNTGTTAKLSFGSLKSISGYSDPTAAAGFTAANLNDVYQVAETSNNLRRAVFAGSTVMEGDLNADVTTPGRDYVTYAFSDANSGSLKLEVNGAIIHQVELTGSVSALGTGNPGSGTGSSLNANGSGFISLSQWGPGLFDNGVPRYSEIQRTSKYRVTTANQRTGWNYLRVIHNVNGVDRTTNYVEWINDPDPNDLSSAGNGLSIFGDDSFSYISGVKYFTSPSGSIRTRISNIYKNVYSNSNTAISFTNLSNATASQIIQSGSGLSSTKITNSTTDSLQALNTNLDSQNELLHISGTINFNRSKSLPGTYTTTYGCGGSMIFVHPLKSNLTLATQSTTNLLVWTPSDTSNANTDEYFTGESYRLISGSYTGQSDVTGGSYDWDSTISMNNQAAHPAYATGLLVYDTYLLAPKDGGIDGDFRNHIEGGGIESPAGNVDYSNLTNSTREYCRSFLNNTVNDRPSIQITLFGDATIIGKTGSNAAALGANKNIFVEVGVPGKTGLLDLGKPSAGSGNFSEGDGCLSGDLNQTVDFDGVTNTCTFNGATADGTVSGAEYIIVKISASDQWTGYLDRISISWS